MSVWHCKQIPNGQEPIVVCERETLKARIEELEAALRTLAKTKGTHACAGAGCTQCFARRALGDGQ